MDFVAQLKRQLSFLERSAATYDLGHYDEAIRMATVMRVLLHQTSKSTSLLQHLNAEKISLLSTAECENIDAVFYYMGLGILQVGSDGSSYQPGLGEGWTKQLIPAQQWWEQVVYVLDRDIRLSRKDIVLAAANQDGGAHVDSKLKPNYAELSRDGGLGLLLVNQDGTKCDEQITGAHFVAIRQMAYELLHSSELQSLIDS